MIVKAENTLAAMVQTAAICGEYFSLLERTLEHLAAARLPTIHAQYIYLYINGLKLPSICLDDLYV